MYYASIGGGLPSSAGKVAAGVDIRGEGGYVIAPPSPGWTYERTLPLATLPASIAEAATAPSHRDSTGQSHSTTRFVARSRVPAGERNDYLASCAGWLFRQGYDLDEVTRALLAENAKVCVPPDDESVVEKIAESIERYHDAV